MDYNEYKSFNEKLFPDAEIVNEERFNWYNGKNLYDMPTIKSSRSHELMVGMDGEMIKCIYRDAHSKAILHFKDDRWKSFAYAYEEDGWTINAASVDFVF